MTTEDMDNPWHIQSIYDFQYFNCPSCIFKNPSKQEFVNHVYNIHPNFIDHLFNVKDNSLEDIVFPNIEIIDPSLRKCIQNTPSLRKNRPLPIEIEARN